MEDGKNKGGKRMKADDKKEEDRRRGSERRKTTRGRRRTISKYVQIYILSYNAFTESISSTFYPPFPSTVDQAVDQEQRKTTWSRCSCIQ